MENVIIFWAPRWEWVVWEDRIRWRMWSYFGLREGNGLSGKGSWKQVENVFIFWEWVVWDGSPGAGGRTEEWTEAPLSQLLSGSKTCSVSSKVELGNNPISVNMCQTTKIVLKNKSTSINLCRETRAGHCPQKVNLTLSAKYQSIYVGHQERS